MLCKLLGSTLGCLASEQQSSKAPARASAGLGSSAMAGRARGSTVQVLAAKSTGPRACLRTASATTLLRSAPEAEGLS